MSAKQFCLKWNNFQSYILNAFESLQNTEDLTDVTLTCESISIKAHKFILSACSPYFRSVFKENPCSHPIIILKDVFYIDLVAIINFMYHGEVLVSEEQLPSFLQTAKLLQVSGLNNSNESSTRKCPKKTKLSKLCTDNPKKKAKVCVFKTKAHKLVNSDIKTDTQTLNKTASNNGSGDEFSSDVNENVEIIVSEKGEQSSILEAALEKPESILERSLTHHSIMAGKSPSSLPHLAESASILQLQSDAKFIPRKPPEFEIDRKRVQPTSSGSSSPSTFDRPAEYLQQTIKIEEEEFYGNPPDPENLNESGGKLLDVVQQPHHSSQCGNCPHCGKVYSNQSALKYHVRLVHSDLTNMYCCHLCPEAFSYREGYKKHMVEVHCIRN